MFLYSGKTRFKMKIHCFDTKFFSSSPPLVPVQLPSQMETHLWYAIPNEVKSESLQRQYLELLSSCEKEKVFRMRGDELKKGALLARALVRTTIARYQINSQVSPRSLKFRKNVHGKPEVEWQHSDDWHPPPLHFNISHTSSLVACGVTIGSPIGIDVEDKQRRIKNNILSFARRYFTQHEVKVLTSILDPEVQRQEFLKLWTLKEAYVKALGRGFSDSPFSTFTVRFGTKTGGNFHLCGNSNSKASDIVVDDPNNPTNNWHLALLELSGSHYAAICTEKDTGKERVPKKLTVWKTIPLVEDTCVSGTDAVVKFAGFA